MLQYRLQNALGTTSIGSSCLKRMPHAVDHYRLDMHYRNTHVSESSIDNTQPSESIDRFFKPGNEGEARQTLFNSISHVYDELNDELSFGMHRIWKKMTVKWSGASQGNTVLDVCCGSGDIAQILRDTVGPSGKVTGLDFSSAMLEDAAARDSLRQRHQGSRSSPRIEWVQGDALDLPFPDDTFDAVTMGYGLRNVSSIPKALSELHRTLRPGCCVAILDFNNNENVLIDSAQAWFLEQQVVPAAEARGVGDEYRYLRPSIQKFPRGREQEKLALQARFVHARHYEIGFGMMGVLVAKK